MSQYDDNASHSAWKQAVRTTRSKFKEAGAEFRHEKEGMPPRRNYSKTLLYQDTAGGDTHTSERICMSWKLLNVVKTFKISDGLEHDRFYKFN